MANELVRTVMNNIARKNIGNLHENDTRNSEDDYEIQKKRSLLNYSSNYRSNKTSNYSSNEKRKKVVDLNSFAREIKGESREEFKASDNFTSRGNEKKAYNKLSLDDLSKISNVKEAKESQKKLSKRNYKNNKNKGALSLEDLARNIKKNI